MGKNYLRKIVVEGEIYLWYRMHYHLERYEQSPCAEVLTVFSPCSRNNPVRIRFREEENRYRADCTQRWWHTGYPQSGVLWLSEASPEQRIIVEINLNRPGVVATLIRLLRATRWNPAETRTPLEIEDGLRFLEEHYPIPKE